MAKLTIFMFVLLLILFVNDTQSQITIGNHTPPVSGALLQLKENDNVDINSTKGMILPRVKLTDKNSLNDLGTGLDNNEHTGLLLFQTERNDQFCPGLYIWNSTEWEPVGHNGNMAPNITMTDGDGNVYNAKWFGEDPCLPNPKGAYWTTENLYSITRGNGSAFSSGYPYLNPAQYRLGLIDETFQVTSSGALASHPNITYAKNNVSVTQTPIDFAKEYGLLYSYEQSQEACPPGWHLPSRADWDLLVSLVEVQNMGIEMRDPTYKSYTASANYPATWDFLPNSTYQYNGLNMRPAGFKHPDPGEVQYFTRIFGFFLLNTGSPQWINVTVADDMSGFAHGVADEQNTAWIYDKDYYLSVRCVKD